MLYYEIKDNIITGIYSGDMPKEKHSDTEYLIVEWIYANIGDDIRMYTDLQAGTKKPLTQLVEEGLVPVPEGRKLNEAGTDFVDMSEAEKLAAGLIQLKPDEKIEGDYIVKKTAKEKMLLCQKEKYNAGLISKEEYNAFIDKQRETAYRQEADALGMQVLRGELDKAEWLTKIAEIKKRYPKAE